MRMLGPTGNPHAKNLFADAADALALALAYAQENRALNFTPLKRI